MKTHRRRFVFGVGLLALFCAGCDSSSKSENDSRATTSEIKRNTETREPITALTSIQGLSAPKVALGKRLFSDKKLSSDGTVACASCHALDQGGDDGLVHSRGVQGAEGGINAPTVLNAALNVAQFWDGRAATLEEQAGGPLTNPIEMANSWDNILAYLRGDDTYVGQFNKAFTDGITRENVTASIAEFERTLITVGGRFDQFLGGKEDALTAQEKQGFSTFKAVGCIACHQGANAGGNMYQKFGVLGDYFAARGDVTENDYGRYNVTKQEKDRYVFRVPSLRNVEHTAPYLHDGSAKTLEEAVQIMAKYQLGRKLDDTQVSDIVAFLHTLSGPLPASGNDG